MKITVIYGQNHKGSTYHIARSLAEKLGGEITEFFLPRDFNDYCCGCTTCFLVSECKCPHYKKLAPITKAIDESDVFILASPVYVLHATAAMKNLLDHYGWRYMVHRPEEKMFKKQAVCITTAAGGGMSSALKDMADSVFHWGVPKIYKYGVALFELQWDKVSPERKRSIDKKLDSIADSIWKNRGHVKAGLKTKGMFTVVQMLHLVMDNKKDKGYWIRKGWLGDKRPWN